MANNAAIQAHVHEWVGRLKRDEILKILEEAEVVCSAVNDASDIIADPHFIERTLVKVTGMTALGPAVMPGPVLHLGSYDGPAYDGFPSIGEHTVSVLREVLDLSDGQIAELTAAGAITTAETG
jgi:crotonobetainyl-CoA:carnitine CoA-transferase CaiB-like acyl-CoA transferase